MVQTFVGRPPIGNPPCRSRLRSGALSRWVSSAVGGQSSFDDGRRGCYGSRFAAHGSRREPSVIKSESKILRPAGLAPNTHVNALEIVKAIGLDRRFLVTGAWRGSGWRKDPTSPYSYLEMFSSTDGSAVDRVEWVPATPFRTPDESSVNALQWRESDGLLAAGGLDGRLLFFRLAREQRRDDCRRLLGEVGAASCELVYNDLPLE